MITILRSFLFYLGVAPATVLFSLIGILILPLPRRWRYFVITRWSRFAMFWLRVTCGRLGEIRSCAEKCWQLPWRLLSLSNRYFWRVSTWVFSTKSFARVRERRSANSKELLVRLIRSSKISWTSPMKNFAP